MNTTTVDLLVDDPCLQLPCQSGSPLDLALQSLQVRFRGILAAEGFAVEDLSVAVLVFEFPSDRDDYWSLCTSTLESASGRRLVHKVEAGGYSHRIRKDTR